MTKITRVINLRKESFDVYIGRQYNSQLFDYGNPYPITMCDSRDESIQRYKIYFDRRIKNDPEFKMKILLLKGKRLGCYCKPKDCHGDVITEYLSQFEVRI